LVFCVCSRVSGVLQALWSKYAVCRAQLAAKLPQRGVMSFPVGCEFHSLGIALDHATLHGKLQRSNA
jgi:hypothetical protein